MSWQSTRDVPSSSVSVSDVSEPTGVDTASVDVVNIPISQTSYAAADLVLTALLDNSVIVFYTFGNDNVTITFVPRPNSTAIATEE